ncbi:hypothetical protein HD806DRAFT_473385 [Xylariaceae sp. AK1471]|nr:hypothetical protein HD806DRAFT_473385 [Xylariaceae sp. AK1471]
MYNTKDSLVVTDPTTDSALSGLSMGERTGSRVFQRLWSYMSQTTGDCSYNALSYCFDAKVPFDEVEKTMMDLKMPRGPTQTLRIEGSGSYI